MSKEQYIQFVDATLNRKVYDHVDKSFSIFCFNLFWHECKENGWNPVEVMGGVV